MSELESGLPINRTILSLCDHSGNWCQPYREAGYNVIQVDLDHGQDVRLLELPKEKIHGILAAPPCTVFASSGARWPRSDADMLEGLSVVDACLRFVVACKPEWWALENPIGKLVRYLGKPKMYFDPCDYGDTYTKRTALWGEFNTALPVSPVLAVDASKMHRLSPSPERARLRSLTPMGFARAFMEANR